MLRLGIVGTGGMAKSHARAYQENPECEVIACCDVDEERASAFAKTWKISEVYTDYKTMITELDLDGISNVTPDAFHASISMYALDNGVAVLCEKPMASSLKEAEEMRQTARKAGLIAMVNFSKRNSTGLQYAKKFIDEGGIGRIIHVEASYLQSWLAAADWGDWREDSRFTWRLSTAHGSLGTLGDIGCHIYDMASFLCGDIVELYCRLETFDKGVDRIGEYVLDANDSLAATVTFSGGAIGTIHSTRWAPGYKNREFVRVYGDKGTVEVDFDKSKETCQVFVLDREEWETVNCEATPSNYERFVMALKTGEQDVSDFENGYKIQQYLHFSELSQEKNAPVSIPSEG